MKKKIKKMLVKEFGLSKKQAKKVIKKYKLNKKIKKGMKEIEALQENPE